MGIMKHQRTIATKGIKPSQETYDTSIQSGLYKLGHSNAHDTMNQSMASSRTYRGAMG